MEVEGDSMMSVFLNELYGFQLDNHRWHPLELRKGKSTKEKVKQSSKQRPNSLEYENVNATEIEESATNGKDGSLECQ
ncbi:hypothetical protein K2173_019864 [Erythroxylum novogranatense]|uniref:Uncharacterized protein n=1 Tax=Erythroxylum novogranatense TaxID=1862640 RepID=A0AAV8SNK1_9ROSI|nr:hypothetical protein K2173_019864 [Erythroxylum novogranatense]